MRRDKSGICSISARGHTGFADAGSDIVCAAVSTLMQALQVGLEDVLEVDGVTGVWDPAAPEMGFVWEDAREAVQVVARTVLLSLEAVANAYPDYVKVSEVF